MLRPSARDRRGAISFCAFTEIKAELMNEHEKIGLLGELLTQYRLAEYSVKSFLTNEPDYDIIAECQGGFKSIQVKTRSRPSDTRGNVTFRILREEDRHIGRGRYVSYHCDVFAFVYLPFQSVLFFPNNAKLSGGFNVYQFTDEMSDLSAKACGFAPNSLHARDARDTKEDDFLSTPKFSF